MKRILLLTILLLGSCQIAENPLDKSIIEPLTIEELRVEMDKDSLFEENYKRIEKAKEKVLTSDIEKAKYSDITYKQVNEYLAYLSDTSIFYPLVRKYDKEWNTKYDYLEIKVDSTLNYWKEYAKRKGLLNSIEQGNYNILDPIILSIPSSVKMYWNEKRKGGLETDIDWMEVAYEDIVKDILNEEYEDRGVYLLFKLDSVASAKQPKIAELISPARFGTPKHSILIK